MSNKGAGDTMIKRCPIHFKPISPGKTCPDCENKSKKKPDKIKKISDEIKIYIAKLETPKVLTAGGIFQALAKIRDHDSFPCVLGNGKKGNIWITEWRANWSVKWYSDRKDKQIQLADPVSEYDARRIFAELRERLKGKSNMKLSD